MNTHPIPVTDPVSKALREVELAEARFNGICRAIAFAAVVDNPATIADEVVSEYVRLEADVKAARTAHLRLVKAAA